jgi:ribosomal protein S18 acetylase RimI-like enzyme
MRTLTFRQATPDDIGDIVALVNSCYRGDSSRVGWTTEADLLNGTRTDEGEIQRLMSLRDSRILLCSSGREIAGSVHIQKQGPACYLGMLVVKPELQNSGVGRQLMSEAEGKARELWGSTKMTMTVITLREELIAYYERRGYRRTGQIKPFVSDATHGIPRVEGIELEVLEKSLENKSSV